jgi:cell division septal protein FtsQ
VRRYLPLAAKLLLAVSAGLLIFKGYSAVASASFFQVKSIEVEGASRVPADEVRAAVRRATGAQGVWKADLDAVARELRELKWVRTATVARVLPSGFRVRIAEREPRLVARNSAGTFDWVDEEGVLLGRASVADANSTFFVRGLDETTTESARQQNRERVAKALEMEREWKASGLIERVSEVNLDNVRDVRAQLSGDYAQIQVFLGEKDFGRRLARAFKALAEVPSPSPRGPVTYLDATRDKGVTVGFSNTPADAAAGTNGAAQSGVRAAQPKSTAREEGVREGEPTGSRRDKRRRDAAARRQKRDTEKTRPGGAAVAAQRPRRVAQ